MNQRQLKPFEQISFYKKDKQLPVFEQAVLEYKGRTSHEDSGIAPLPESYPYRTRMTRRVYEKEKTPN